MTRSIRVFYVLLLTQTFSLIGSRMSSLALGIQVFNTTREVLPLALVSVFYALPLIAAAGFAGVVADRWDRRWVLILSDTGQAIGSVLLLVSFVSGAFQLWHLYAVTFLQSFFGIFQHPAFQASVTLLIPDDQRDRANAVQQLTNPAAGLIAPLLAGVLFGLIGVTGIILLDLMTFLVAVGVVILIRIPRPEQSDEGQAARMSMWSDMATGFQVLWRRRILFYFILFITGVNFLWNIFSAVLTPYILTVTGSEAILGTLFSVGSAGLILSGLLMSVWKIKRTRMQIILPTIIAIGVFMTPFGLTHDPVLMGVILFLLNTPHPIINTLLISILQLKTPPDVQGRVFAAVAQLALLAAPIGLLLGGFLSDTILEPRANQPGTGMGLLIVITGLIYTIAGLLLFSWPRMRHLESEVPDYHTQPT